jgi:hypothetical protein
VKRIELTQGFTAIVDDQDFEYLGQWKWHASKSAYNWYAARFVGTSPRHKVYMHREIARRKYADLDGQQVDHDDGDPMNNRRENLIARTQQENLSRRRGYRPCVTVTSEADEVPF